MSIFIAAMALATVQAGFTATPVTLLRDRGQSAQSLQAVLAHDNLKQVSIVLLWRSDCAPCLVELGRLVTLQQAAGKAKIVMLALEDPATAWATARRRGLVLGSSFATVSDPRIVLGSADTTMTYLPKSVAISANGRVCDSHMGILGTDIIRDWVAKC
jgi:thiol-disulfide isomerase/thioredoxin